MIEDVVLEELSPQQFLKLLSNRDEEIESLQARLDLLQQGGTDPDALVEEPGFLVPRYRTPDGWCVATVHWSLVPGYDYAAVCEGQSPESIRQEVEIDWTATRGKRVYREYGKLHQAVQPLVYDPARPLYCGWDFGAHAGGTPAWVPTQVNTFGQWLLFPPIAPLEEESIGTYDFGQLVADHLQREYAQPNGLKWRDLKMMHYGDPNGAQRPPRTGDRPQEMQSHFQILDRGMNLPLGSDREGQTRYQRLPGFGFKIQPGPVNVTPRLDAVRARLRTLLPGGLPGLVVDPRATVLKDGFSGGYSFKKKADGSYEDTPDKNWYSHCLTGDSLIETQRGHIPIKSVTVKDQVMTRMGWRQVRRSWCSGISPLVEVTFSDGTQLKATKEHKIWTQYGWIEAGSLRYNDVCNVRPSPLRGVSTHATLTHRTGRIGSIIGTAAARTRSGFTRLFGNQPTDPSLLDMRSTTRMVIPRTMPWRTWLASHMPSTWWRMRREGHLAPPCFWSTWRTFAPSLWPGIVRPKVEPGIPSMGKRLPLLLQSAHLSVNAVAKSISPRFSTTGPSIAEGLVLPRLDGTLAWMMKPGFALGAKKSSSSTAMPSRDAAPIVVQRVSAIPGVEPVYDLSVDGAHEFYANGVLVHNSFDALAYIAACLFALPEDEKDEYDLRSRSRFRCQASGRMG